MDTINNKISSAIEQLRKKAYDDLADVLISGLKDDSISLEDCRLMARYLNYRLGPAKTEDEIISFLVAFGKMWDIYRNACTKIVFEQKEKNNKVKLNEIQQKLHKFSLSI